MKRILFVLVFLLFSQVASADTLLKFRDGSASVWDNIYVKGNQYCTQKAYGAELCSPAVDVVLKKTVPAGTDPLEYGTADTGGLQAQSDNVYAAQEAENIKKRQEAAKKPMSEEDFQRLVESKRDPRYRGKPTIESLIH